MRYFPEESKLYYLQSLAHLTSLHGNIEMFIVVVQLIKDNYGIIKNIRKFLQPITNKIWERIMIS